NYLHSSTLLDLPVCRALHIDGHRPDAALHYARACRDAGILTSLDGGGVRINTHELLGFIDVAIVSERFCQQLKMTTEQTLDYLAARGCRIGGGKHGEHRPRRDHQRGRPNTPPTPPTPAGPAVDTRRARGAVSAPRRHAR